MIQIILALAIIVIFLSRLFWQKHHKKITNNEFFFWLIFWLGSAIVILFIKQIDRIVAQLGFSGPGIQILFYLAVAILFYFIFKIRLRIERIEKDITKITEYLAKSELKK